jgi:hypothetical protein
MGGSRAAVYRARLAAVGLLVPLGACDAIVGNDPVIFWDGGGDGLDPAADAGRPLDASGGIDGGGIADSGGTLDSSGMGRDGGGDAGEASTPSALFGQTCPPGTTYADPLTSDPIADGTFISLAGSTIYNSASDTFSLEEGTPNTQLWIGPRSGWTNYTVTVPIRIDTSDNGNTGVTFRMQSTPDPAPDDSGEMYFAGIALGGLQLGTMNDNEWTDLSYSNMTMNEGTFYVLRVSVSGNTLNVSLDGTTYLTNVVDKTFTFGGFGLRSFKMGATFGAITVTCD